jgi:phosphatidylserine/phosphatidylglycerophosphate/cardiolipin synthase-like enzyme
LSERIAQLLSGASPSVLKAVGEAADGYESLHALSESALNLADRTTLRSLVSECRNGGFDFARGMALGMLTKQESGDFKLVISAPFESDGRQTAGVLAELIGRSERSLSICSYVLVYLDELLPLFSEAQDRGVSTRVLLDNIAGRAKSASSTLVSLSSIIGQENVRFWGAESNGGESLHAKFVVSDDTALVTSANMTGRAVTRNVEVGCLLSDSESICVLSNMFDRLWFSSVV